MRVVVHVDGKVVHTDHDPDYRGGRRIYFSIERGINFNTFKEMIIKNISGTDISMVFKFPTLSYPNTPYNYTTIDVDDDGGVGMIFDMVDHLSGYILEVFTTTLDCGNLSQNEERSFNRSRRQSRIRFCQGNMYNQDTETDFCHTTYIGSIHNEYTHQDHSLKHGNSNIHTLQFPTTANDDEYESSLEDVDQRLGEDGDDVDVEIEINEMSILEAPSTIMTQDTWTNVVDPTSVIPYSSNLGWDRTSELFKGQELTGGFNPSYDKTWLGKQIAIASIFGDRGESYQKLLRHGQAVGRQVFWAAQELQPWKFERELNKTKRFVVTNGPDKGKEKVYDDVMNIPLDRWSFAHDDGKQYDSLTTNVVECFNGVLIDT
ncbi:hypothetical protein Vadar_027831 [Vaccinium darrowii]|uniref:Uncharacterized protein n=1 Tax=Vaccinium darrowii TaxID=229202 RepID=A0ACB7YZW6_9ERIC|nr:hypothetical protein Vadar_027831 [Vaccinium darrowii]